MAVKKISELVAHTAPLPADLLAIVTAGVTKNISLANLWSALFAPEGFLINGKIVPSVDGSGNLTVALKGMDGNDPSATNPVYVRIGSVVRAITGALSATINAGASTFNAGSAELATKEIDYATLLRYNATDGVCIGVARIFHGTLYSDFSTTATNEKYAAWNITTNAAAGDNVVLIGRFAATLSAGAGYTWSVPTFTAKNLIQRPIYETRWLNSESSPTGFSSVSYSNLTYKIVMDKLYITPTNTSIQGTSNDTTFSFKIPFTSIGSLTYLTTYIQDSGIDLTGGELDIPGNSNVINVYKSFYHVAFTNSGAKAVYLPPIIIVRI